MSVQAGGQGDFGETDLAVAEIDTKVQLLPLTVPCDFKGLWGKEGKVEGFFRQGELEGQEVLADRREGFQDRQKVSVVERGEGRAEESPEHFPFRPQKDIATFPLPP
jgi:hypothetical protein